MLMRITMLHSLSVASFLVATALAALPLPDYIKPCALSDPNFLECCRKHAMEAVPHFIHGDPKYRVPPLEPMVISELYIDEGTRSVGMTLHAINATLHGLKNVNITAIRFDLKNQHVEYDWYFPKLDVELIYNVSGRVLILPIYGYGPGFISFKDVSAYFKYDFDLIKKKDNKRYLVPKKASLDFTPKGLSLKLENLFNGDKFLGDNMNRFLNENWDEILKDIGPAIADALSEFIKQVLTNIFWLVPFDDAIPQTL